jgi:redox-sensitive bicupin YhaK (pirin superfamily)
MSRAPHHGHPAHRSERKYLANWADAFTAVSVVQKLKLANAAGPAIDVKRTEKLELCGWTSVTQRMSPLSAQTRSSLRAPRRSEGIDASQIAVVGDAFRMRCPRLPQISNPRDTITHTPTLARKRAAAHGKVQMAVRTSTFAVQKSNDRFYADHGWLRTYHSFSFADYHDPANMNWGALRVFNDDRVAGGQGFPTHPHQNMEIVTYVFEGKLEHRDTLGSHGIVESGGVQYLSAGTGLRHSEFNASPDRELHFVQMWVLPGTLNARPTYGQFDFDVEARRNRWLAVASGEAADAPIRLTQTATLRVTKLEGTTVSHGFAAGRLGFLFIGQGEAAVTARDLNGESHAASLRAGDAVRVADIGTIDVSGDAELVFWDVPAVHA